MSYYKYKTKRTEMFPYSILSNLFTCSITLNYNYSKSSHSISQFYHNAISLNGERTIFIYTHMTLYDLYVDINENIHNKFISFVYIITYIIHIIIWIRLLNVCSTMSLKLLWFMCILQFMFIHDIF